MLPWMLAGTAAVLVVWACLDRAQPLSSVALLPDSVLSATCEASAPDGPELSQPIAWQLHTHALSNHGSSSRPASMQYDSYQAAHEGLGGILWSEHLPVFDQGDSEVVSPSTGALTTDSLNVVSLSGDVTRLGAVRSATGNTTATLDGSGLLLSASGGSPGAPAQIRYYTQHLWSDHVARWPESLSFNRPLSSGAEAVLQYRLCSPTSGPLEVYVRLSWHVDASGTEHQHMIHYILDPSIGSDSIALEAPGVVQVRRHIATAGTVTLDLLRDASNLPDGDDNTVVDISWAVQSTDSSVHCIGIQKMVLRSTSTSMESNMAQSVRFAQRYAERYGYQQLVGFEGWTVSPELAAAGFSLGGRAGAHMGVLLPTEDPSPLPAMLSEGGRTLVRHVHELCGVAAVNHPYGFASFNLPGAIDVSQRPLVQNFLLRQRAFQADLLEVGLPYRGDSLNEHLILWDRLSAAGVTICGIGTSDAHGWRWDNPKAATYTENHNPFVTWLWQRATTRVGVVSALRRCRAFFGNPFAFAGSIDFRVQGLGVMGQTLHPTSDSVALDLETTGTSALQTWLVQGLITGSTTDPVQYVTRRQLPPGTSTVTVDASRSSFVRFEFLGSDGSPAAYSNPVWLIRRN